MKTKSNGTGARPDPRAKNYRFFVVAAVFLLLLIALVVYLFIVLAKGPFTVYEQYDVRTETVQGERGRIFDRNGKLLVGNSTHYDFIFEYGAMAYSAQEVNDALLLCIDALEQTGNASLRAKDHFVLSGTYPNMAFAEGARDLSNDIGHYYNRFLVRNELPQSTSASDVAEFFVKKYKLDSGRYSNKQISELIRIYYDMDRVGFGFYQYYTIASGFQPSQESHMALISYIKEKRVEGATFIKQADRVYYYEDYASHILGSVGKIYAEEAEEYKALGYSMDAIVGKSGCELAFESYLRGTDGTKVSKYDKDGNLVEEYYDPAPTVGYDVYLTIDLDLQIAAEDALAAEIEDLEHSDAGAATAIDPNTGEVLVIASYPTFDISQFNRALYGEYAPGSTYKIGSALAALEEGHISTSTSYTCNQVYPHLGGPTCLGNHGPVTVTDAIEVSCNIFFYYVGHELGLDKITPYTEKLGLGVPTGIELGESTGSVANEDLAKSEGQSWLEFDDATGAIGQSKHAYTPLQLSVYMSTVVNGGTRYSARLLHSVCARTGEEISSPRPEVADTLNFSENTYNTLIRGMRAVVTTNLTSCFADVDAVVGGKTGTAETGRYINGKQIDNALFSGFAPLDSPQIVASCVLEAGEGGSRAANVVAAIFEEYFDVDESSDEIEE